MLGTFILRMLREILLLYIDIFTYYNIYLQLIRIRHIFDFINLIRLSVKIKYILKLSIYFTKIYIDIFLFLKHIRVILCIKFSNE